MNLLRGLGVMFVVAALAVTAAADTFVASDQQRIDALETQLSQALAAQQNLQLTRAELESPSRCSPSRNVTSHGLTRAGDLPRARATRAFGGAGPSGHFAAALAAAAAKAAELAPPSRPGPALPAKTRTSTSLAGPGSSAVTAPTG